MDDINVEALWGKIASRLEEETREDPRPIGERHITRKEAYDYLERTMSPDKEQQIEAHVGTCEECFHSLRLAVAVKRALTEGDITTQPVEIDHALRQSQRPSLRVIRGGAEQPRGVEQPLRLAAQQQSEAGWPLLVEVDVEGASSPARLEFTWLGFDLVVQYVCPPEVRDAVVVRLENTPQEIPLSPGAKASLGPLKAFHLTSKSSTDEIADALVSAGFTVETE